MGYTLETCRIDKIEYNMTEHSPRGQGAMNQAMAGVIYAR